MKSKIGLRRISDAVCDGTGLTQEELWVMVAVTVSVAAASGVLRAFDAVVRAIDSVRDG
jgi:hypothetical protein